MVDNRIKMLVVSADMFEQFCMTCKHLQGVMGASGYFPSSKPVAHITCNGPYGGNPFVSKGKDEMFCMFHNLRLGNKL